MRLLVCSFLLATVLHLASVLVVTASEDFVGESWRLTHPDLLATKGSAHRGILQDHHTKLFVEQML